MKEEDMFGLGPFFKMKCSTPREGSIAGSGTTGCKEVLISALIKSE